MHRATGKNIIAMALLVSMSFSNIVLAGQTTEHRIEYSNEYNTAWKLIQLCKEGTNEATIKCSGDDIKLLVDNQSRLELAQSIALATTAFDGVDYKIAVSYKPDTNGTFNAEITAKDKSLHRLDEVQSKVKEIAQLARDYSPNKRKQVEFVNNYIVDNAYYDKESQISKDESTGAWQAYGVLLNGKGVCASYAYVVCLILQELDIPVVNIRESNHIYNRVYIDHQWYNLDTTFNDPILLGDWSSEAAKDLTIRESKGSYTLVTDEVLTLEGRTPIVDAEKIQQAKYPELLKDTENIKKLTVNDLKVGKNGRTATRLDVISLIGLQDGKYVIPENFESYVKLCDDTYINLKNGLTETQRACVGYAIERGIINETENKMFIYDKEITNKEMASIILRLRGINDISWEELERTSVYKRLSNSGKLTVGTVKDILFIKNTNK